MRWPLPFDLFSWIMMERITKIGNLCNLLNIPENRGKPCLSPSTAFYYEENCANISLLSKIYNQMRQPTNKSQCFQHSGTSIHVQPWMKPRWLISYTSMNVCTTWKRCLLSLYLCSPIKHNPQWAVIHSFSIQMFFVSLWEIGFPAESGLVIILSLPRIVKDRLQL